MLFLKAHPLVPDRVGVEGRGEGMPNREPVAPAHGLPAEIGDLRVSGYHDSEASIEIASIEDSHCQFDTVRRGNLQPFVKNPDRLSTIDHVLHPHACKIVTPKNSKN